VDPSSGSLAATLWFVAGLVMILAEFGLPGLVIAFFGAGAWVVSAAVYFGWVTSLSSQLLLFAGASVLLMAGLRRWVRGKFLGHVTGPQDLEKNLDEFTGQRVVVLRDILPGREGGEVELKGANWRAVSREALGAGETAVVERIDGLTLTVRKPEER